MTSPALIAKATKRVTFYNKVAVLYISPINVILRKELFYRRADYRQFEMDAYIESMLCEGSQPPSSEQTQGNGLSKELPSASVSKIQVTPSKQAAPRIAVAA